jgi:SpoU rRNA methylase family enzyme
MFSFNFLVDNVDGAISVLSIDINAESEEEAYNSIYNRYSYGVDILECVCTSEPGFDKDEMENGRLYRYGDEY